MSDTKAADTSSPTGPTTSGGGEPRMVDCVKFGKRMEGLPKPPLKGDFGKRVFENISKEAWAMWVSHSKMLVNEFRLDLLSETGQRVWMTEAEKFLFGPGSQLPPDYVPPKH